jgi:hypothetical protein
MSTLLNPKIIKNISDQVYRRFPEVAGVKPTIKKQPGGKNKSGKSENGSFHILLTFRGSVDVGDGKRMVRLVRVVVDNRGDILKMTTSR